MKGKFWRKALAAALALLIVSGSTPIQPLSQVFEDIAITASAEDIEGTTVTSDTTTMTTGSYIVDSDVTIDDRITINGDVTLYLSEGTTLTAIRGIELSSGNKLTINGSGMLSATGIEGYYIGSGIGANSFGELVINGGIITATGTDWSAGIGGSYDFYNKTGNKNTGSITVNGGIVNANGGKSAAGIGGSRGSSDNDGGYGINFTFNGGKVTVRKGISANNAIGAGNESKTNYGWTFTVGWTNVDDFIDHNGIGESPSITFATGKKFARSGETMAQSRILCKHKTVHIENKD